MDNMPVITLSSGVRVANFSSPHAFTFDDGSVLPSCSKERSKAGMLRAVEKEEAKNGWVDIDLNFEMSEKIAEMLIRSIQQSKDEKIDVVVVPYAVLTAWKGEYGDAVSALLLEAAKKVLGEQDACYGRWWEPVPFRTIRMADRITKTCCHDKFCK